MRRTVIGQDTVVPLEVTPIATMSSARTAVILQPSYLPWLGFFAQFHRSDVFVLYDDVQYTKQSWQNRNRIKTATGPIWLTVPILKHGRHGQLIRDTEIDNRSRWQTKHLRSLEYNYRKAPYFAEYMSHFAVLYERPWRFLLDLDLASLELTSSALGIRREIRISSQLGIPSTGVMDRLIAICRALGANAYYNGAAGRAYYDPEYFAARGISMAFQDYRHPEYPQLFGTFVPYVSVLDLLFNCGPESLRILLTGEARHNVDVAHPAA